MSASATIRNRRAIFSGLVASVVCIVFATAVPAYAYTWVTAVYNGGVMTSTGVGLQNISGAQQVQFYLDPSGHALLRRVSDGVHCASWPSATTTAPGTSSTRRMIYYAGSTQKVELQYQSGGVWGTYATIPGSVSAGGTTVDIELYSGQWNLYIGNTRIHGC
jgi:hypothetical protein